MATRRRSRWCSVLAQTAIAGACRQAVATARSSSTASATGRRPGASCWSPTASPRPDAADHHAAGAVRGDPCRRRRRPARAAFPRAVPDAAVRLAGAFLTGDLFNLFVFFEVLLIASYGLLLHGGGAERTRAGLHYVVLNLLGSTVFLFAAGLLYATLGTLNMADLALKAAALPAQDLGAGARRRPAAAGRLRPEGRAAAAAPLAARGLCRHQRAGGGTVRDHDQGGRLRDPARRHADVRRTGTARTGQPVRAWLLPLALATLAASACSARSAAESLRELAAYLVVASVGTAAHRLLAGCRRHCRRPLLPAARHLREAPRCSCWPRRSEGVARRAPTA
jgi:hypothetical protein